MNEDIVAITRHNPSTHESVLLIAHTCFSTFKWTPNCRPIQIADDIVAILFELKTVELPTKEAVFSWLIFIQIFNKIIFKDFKWFWWFFQRNYWWTYKFCCWMLWKCLFGHFWGAWDPQRSDSLQIVPFRKRSRIEVIVKYFQWFILNQIKDQSQRRHKDRLSTNRTNNCGGNDAGRLALL